MNFADVHYNWQERAAIVEYEGDLPRPQAEWIAWQRLSILERSIVEAEAKRLGLKPLELLRTPPRTTMADG